MRATVELPWEGGLASSLSGLSSPAGKNGLKVGAQGLRDKTVRVLFCCTNSPMFLVWGIYCRKFRGKVMRHE